MKQTSKISKPKKRKRPEITPEQAVAACDTLIAFVAPMYKGAQRDADMFAIVSFREFLSQLTGFRSVVNEIISEDYVNSISTTDNSLGSLSELEALELVIRDKEREAIEGEQLVSYFENLFQKAFTN